MESRAPSSKPQLLLLCKLLLNVRLGQVCNTNEHGADQIEEAERDLQAPGVL